MIYITILLIFKYNTEQYRKFNVGSRLKYYFVS